MRALFVTTKVTKKDKKLIKIESDDRVGRILTAAHHYSDFHLNNKISQVNLKEKAFYHNQCLTKYLVGKKEVDEEPCSENISDYQTAFSKLVLEIRKNLMENKKAFLLSSLLEIFFSYFPENVAKSFTDCNAGWKIITAVVLSYKHNKVRVFQKLCLAAPSQLGTLLEQLLSQKLN
ncbi:unnamed protein product [Mytilus coruscus]|uniref:Uncharacterized protein n=1 Tax=Mytilus coruscus TaxID=42192 RepID=A0A6J8CSV4_MYTCO|nr:unnamed protein product [Mytilus coruscus]